MSVLSASSSSLMMNGKRFSYGVFLSFNGNDTRRSFTDHLYSALTRRRIETFRDDKSLERGEDFAPELLQAIRESWGSIIVISKGYAFSHWCLEELVEIMRQRKEIGHKVYPIFYYVEPSDFRHQINSVKEAFDKHEKRYDKETTQGWRVALKEVTAINGWPLKDQYESIFIEDIVNDVLKKFDAEILDEQQVEKMKSTFQRIQALLVDAENKQFMKQGELVKFWMDKLKLIAYEMDDVLDEWNTTILKIENDQGQTPSTSSSSLSKVCNILLRIKELNEKYQAITREKDDFPVVLGLNNSCIDFTFERPKTVSLIDESDVYGRDHDKDAIIRLLLSKNNGEGGGGKGIPVIAIVGMGGLGKTTLAQLIYNHDEVKDHFPLRIWVCVSDPFNEVRIAKAILETLKRGTVSKSKELESLLQEICEYIEGSKFLLVLDDVWIEDEKKWEPLKLSLCVLGSPESKILVTTRKEKVAGILGCHKPYLLGMLSDKDSWSLFNKIAFSGRSYQDRENFERIGRKFVEKCAGLPLAIKTLASLLRFKKTREQWQRILDSHVWELDEAKQGLFSPLLLSYYDLPLPLRQCFSYCAIFPKDRVIMKDLLIKLWMAQGFLGEGSEMEIVGEEYFDSLVTRSFFQEFKKDANDDSIIISCKMHDIVHDFAQFLRKTEYCVVESKNIEACRADFYHENVRHLTLIHDNKYKGIPDPIYNVRRLRSLLLGSTSISEASWPKLFNQLTCLRMLNLSNSSIKELPKEIGRLIHLRYLNLEGTEVFELPEAVCDLCNLQTLNIRWCKKLRKLPYGMEKLINLRHLQNRYTRTYDGFSMPKGMQRLTCLLTLDEFSVVKKGGGTKCETSFSLAELGKLIHLRGSLEIQDLGNVREATEASEAQLSRKTGLRSLSLEFGGGRRDRIEDEALVLQALHPPQHLQILRIWFLEGPALPNWMTSLTSLKRVELSHCYKWESLPPMGKLPSLESLSISRMEKVKKVGEEFVGVERYSFSSSVNHNNIAFPNLKTLEFFDMYEWEEWEYDEKALANITTIMPKLQRLTIVCCALLKTVPLHLIQSTALQELDIYGSPILYRLLKETGRPGLPSLPFLRSTLAEAQASLPQRNRAYVQF